MQHMKNEQFFPNNINYVQRFEPNIIRQRQNNSVNNNNFEKRNNGRQNRKNMNNNYNIYNSKKNKNNKVFDMRIFF